LVMRFSCAMLRESGEFGSGCARADSEIWLCTITSSPTTFIIASSFSVLTRTVLEEPPPLPACTSPAGGATAAHAASVTETAATVAAGSARAGTATGMA
jgi:hypothetical protein